jgi:hypothetical protein
VTRVRSNQHAHESSYDKQGRGQRIWCHAKENHNLDAVVSNCSHAKYETHVPHNPINPINIFHKKIVIFENLNTEKSLYYNRHNYNIDVTVCLHVLQAYMHSGSYVLPCSSKAEVMHKYKVNVKSSCCL